MSDPANVNPDFTAQQPDLGRRRFWQGVLTGGAALASPGFSAFAHGGGFGMSGCGSPEARLERAEFASDWMLTRVGASDAPKEPMRAIVRRTLGQLAPLRREHRAHRRSIMEMPAAPSVDAGRLAELRAAEPKLADQAAQALLAGATDAATAATPAACHAMAAAASSKWSCGERSSALQSRDDAVSFTAEDAGNAEENHALANSGTDPCVEAR